MKHVSTLGCCRHCFQASDIPAEQQAEQRRGRDRRRGEGMWYTELLISSQCFSNSKELSALVLRRGSFWEWSWLLTFSPCFWRHLPVSPPPPHRECLRWIRHLSPDAHHQRDDGVRSNYCKCVHLACPPAPLTTSFLKSVYRAAGCCVITSRWHLQRDVITHEWISLFTSSL